MNVFDEALLSGFTAHGNCEGAVGVSVEVWKNNGFSCGCCGLWKLNSGLVVCVCLRSGKVVALELVVVAFLAPTGLEVSGRAKFSISDGPVEDDRKPKALFGLGSAVVVECVAGLSLDEG